MKVLVIGQGIAGTLLTWMLQQRGVEVVVADGQLPGASSLPAAGVINPVTGKRFVKSWRFETFFPVAQRVYHALAAELGKPILTENSILRLLATPEEVNDWSARCSQDDYQSYLSEPKEAGGWEPLLKPGFHYGEIHRAGRVDFPALLSGMRHRWLQAGCYLGKHISPEEVPDQLASFDKVVYCEGFRGADNPFFPDPNWRVAKGEALIIRFSEHPESTGLQHMLKKTAIVAPLGNGLFWVGGTYQWHFPDLEPSDGEKQYLLDHLRQMVDAPFEIIRHVAAVRPTVKDRRPLLGESPVKQGVYLFNGMGTKGALLAPYWAEHFANYLLEGASLDPEADLKRCYVA